MNVQIENLMDDPVLTNLFYIGIVIAVCFAVFYFYSLVTNFKSEIKDKVERLNTRIEEYNVNNPFEVLERFSPSEIGKKHCAEKLEQTEKILKKYEQTKSLHKV